MVAMAGMRMPRSWSLTSGRSVHDGALLTEWVDGSPGWLTPPGRSGQGVGTCQAWTYFTVNRDAAAPLIPVAQEA
jgi:hypothetical protein